MVDFRYLELGSEPNEPPPAGAASLDYFDLCRIAPPPRLLKRYSLALLDRYRWLPLHEATQDQVDWLPRRLPAPLAWGSGEGTRLFIAAVTPDDAERMRAVAMRTGRALRAIPVHEEALDRFLSAHYPAQEAPQQGWWPLRRNR